MKQFHSGSITIPAARSIAIVSHMPAIALFVLGAVTLYCIGFSNSSVAHNATHDTRHASGFPCH